MRGYNRDIIPIMENQIDKNMETDTETACARLAKILPTYNQQAVSKMVVHPLKSCYTLNPKPQTLNPKPFSLGLGFGGFGVPGPKLQPLGCIVFGLMLFRSPETGCKHNPDP